MGITAESINTQLLATVLMNKETGTVYLRRGHAVTSRQDANDPKYVLDKNSDIDAYSVATTCRFSSSN